MHEIGAKVVSGRGMASERRQREIAELSRITGMDFVDGSLNLVAAAPLWLDPERAVYKAATGHRYWLASMEGIPIVLNRWRGGCPAHVYEVYAGVRLRDALGLEDGGRVRISLNDEMVNTATSSSVKHRLTWYLFWFGREKLYYSSDWYTAMILRKPLQGYAWRAMQG